MKRKALDTFASNLYRLHSGIEVDFYKDSIDAGFEYICGALLSEKRDSEIWYDGTGDLALNKIDDGLLMFNGNMHVAHGQTKFWREEFTAIVHVTEKDTNFRIDVTCGEYQASGYLYTMFEHSIE